jgi:parallel beta-helix repeat protein
MDVSFRGLMYGLALYDCYNCTIVDSEIIDSTLMGIYAYNCESITIENSNISDNGDGGIVLYNSNSACILGNQITNNRGIGVYAHQSYYANISFNVISDGHPDHELSFSHDDDIPCAGIRGYNEYYLTASYNEIYDNQGYGIALNQCHAVRIFGNKIGWNTEGNARDDYNRNHWDSETSYVLEDYEGIGNFWSDYNGTGPYVINGDSMDRWPVLWEFDPPSIVPLDNIHFDDPTRRRLVNWTAQDLAPHRFIAYLDGSEYDTAPWDGSEITVDVTDLEIGQYNLTLKLMDKIGNQASDQITLTIEVAYTGNDVVYTGSTTPFTIGEDSIQIIFAIGVGGVAVLALVGADLYLRKRNAV